MAAVLPRGFGAMSPKSMSLITLTVQNSAFCLLLHYSRVMPIQGRRYLPSTAVLMNEILKLGISAFIALQVRSINPHSRAKPPMPSLTKAIFSRDCWKLAVPAALYTLQNSLQYVAGSNLDAATFQVLYQLRILTTACFSVWFLGKRLSNPQWSALLLLTIGVALVQISPGENSAWTTVRRFFALVSVEDRMLFGRESQEIAGAPPMNRTVGFLAVSIACITSGAAGVYLERVLKSTPASLWIRNIQLSGFSLVPALLIGVLYNDGSEIREHGFFAGYNAAVWALIIVQATSGIVVALVVKYADNLAKNFATSISILLCSLISVYFFQFRITWNVSEQLQHKLTRSSFLGQDWLYMQHTCTATLNASSRLVPLAQKPKDLSSSVQ